MTDEEIDAMEAGRELDDVIGQRVMRLPPDAPLPHYSTDIAAAWQVVEKLRKTYGGWRRFAEAFERQSPWHWAALSTEAFCRNVCWAALKCCKAVADKKEDAVEASPSIELTAKRA